MGVLRLIIPVIWRSLTLRRAFLEKTLAKEERDAGLKIRRENGNTVYSLLASYD